METTIYIIVIWYVLNILWLVYGFSKVKSFNYSDKSPSTKFTIVIPFRNEAKNLTKILESIEKLNYPKNMYCVILVDDESSDEFQINSYNFSLSLLKNNRKTKSPKKDAINTAIEKVDTEWIITTDADCIVPENWLKTYDAYIQENYPKMMASGVYYLTENNFISNFQQLDIMSLQGTTIGSFGNSNAFMCNGANFAYRKDFFEILKGFEGNNSIASGDDVFLLQKAIAYEKDNVHFVKSNMTLVETQTENTWSKLFNQRVRWASKTANYNSFYSKQLGLSVLLMNLIWIFSVILYLFNYINLKLVVTIIVLKFIVDTLLLSKTYNFFNLKFNYLFLSNIFYPFFSSTVAIYSIIGKYNWKGRIFTK